MHDVATLTNAVTHQIYAATTSWARRTDRTDRGAPEEDPHCDRGAVSLEQVLWFVAAGVSVAVIAAILWGQIKDKANDPVISPAAP
ncbi:MAG TPA: hypothetical protein VIS05_01390 [Ilumatobacter sp.]